MYSTWRRPPHLMVSEPGSFAEYTIRVRKPQIIADIMNHNDYPADVERALRAFSHEIAEQAVAPLSEETPDRDLWRQAWEPFKAARWHDLPWYLAETFFYRRVLEITRYFQPGKWHGVDPFARQKRQALTDGLSALASIYHAMPSQAMPEARFAYWIYQSVWGNRADLSNIPVSTSAFGSLRDGSELLLIDHSHEAWALLSSGRVQRLDLVADNAGLELLVDLGMVAFLLNHTPVQSVCVHLKRYPFFVSDAMPVDCEAAIEALCTAPVKALADLGNRLKALIDRSRLQLTTDPFWSTCLFFSQFPQPLYKALQDSDLLILKGDVNYRRLLEDRHWPAATPLEEITTFMPSSFLALRTLKGELIVGLPDGLARHLDRQDADWLINGKRGLIHLVARP